MDKNKFQKILFKVACGAIASDGKIDDQELEELRNLDKSTVYFESIDLSKNIDIFVDGFKNKPKETIEDVFSEISEHSYSIIEELLIIEITLRLIYADIKVHGREIDFIKRVRSILSIDNETLTDRFGNLDFLKKDINLDMENKIVRKKVDKTNESKMKELEHLYHIPDDK